MTPCHKHADASPTQIAKLFGMRVVAWSPHLTKERADAAGVDLASSKEDLFRQADLLSIHLVLSPTTRHLVTAADFALMKPTAFFFNTSRGPIVDEAALIEMLSADRLAGVGLDVYDVEPLPLDHPLRSFSKATFSPHNAYVSKDVYKVTIWLLYVLFSLMTLRPQDMVGCHSTKRNKLSRRKGGYP